MKPLIIGAGGLRGSPGRCYRAGANNGMVLINAFSGSRVLVKAILLPDVAAAR